MCIASNQLPRPRTDSRRVCRQRASVERQGIAIKEALLEAAARRCLRSGYDSDSHNGAGAEWKNGLGWALIGGLVCSMFLSLVIILVVYYGFYRVREKLGAKK